MEIIKEKWINKEYETVHIIIRTDCYTSKFSHFLMLKEILDKDFPGIEYDPDPDIAQYGGRRYKGTFGLEMRLPIKTTIPKEYEEIKTIEYKL